MNHNDDITPTSRQGATRQKILEAAYELFSAHGVNLVGVDTISAHSNVAKMTLYHHFRCKENLVLAYLDLRAKRWTEGWLKAGVAARAETPRDQLLAIFELLDEWFATEGFEGCPLLRILSETEIGSPVHTATAGKIDEIESFIADLARAARLPNAAGLASAWMALIEGAIISARAGHKTSALNARYAAELLVDAWAEAAPQKPAVVRKAAR